MTQLSPEVIKLYKLVDDLSLFWRHLCYEILKWDAFNVWPASTKWHHVYEGGLRQHTAEVAILAHEMTSPLGTVPADVIVTAAVFHDAMKVRDYERNFDPQAKEKWIKTKYAKRIHHIHGSYALLNELARAKVMNSTLGQQLEEIGHIILSHHGRPEWGSAVEPDNAAAQIFHTADMISASGWHQPFVESAKTFYTLS